MRVAAEFGADPRAMRKWTLWDLASAWGMVPVLRRERIADQAQAARIARISDDRKFEAAIRKLETGK